MENKIKELRRCDWANQYEIFIPYHDEEWGTPLHDDLKLFEMLCLEFMQAGLSWRLILEKRQGFNKAFHNFNPDKISKFNEKKVEQLLQNKDIIRNRAKINAAINNAKQYLTLKEQGIKFSDFLWQVVDGKPIINQWKKQQAIPAQTRKSAQLSKLLKQHQFKFIGPTTAYAFMQAVGMVNDHLISCFRYPRD